jgi:hypothetical protein
MERVGGLDAVFVAVEDAVNHLEIVVVHKRSGGSNANEGGSDEWNGAGEARRWSDSTQLIDSVEDAEHSALEAVRKFLDTVDGVFPPR